MTCAPPHSLQAVDIRISIVHRVLILHILLKANGMAHSVRAPGHTPALATSLAPNFSAHQHHSSLGKGLFGQIPEDKMSGPNPAMHRTRIGARLGKQRSKVTRSNRSGICGRM